MSPFSLQILIDPWPLTTSAHLQISLRMLTISWMCASSLKSSEEAVRRDWRPEMKYSGKGRVFPEEGKYEYIKTYITYCIYILSSMWTNATSLPSVTALWGWSTGTLCSEKKQRDDVRMLSVNDHHWWSCLHPSQPTGLLSL